MNDMTQIPRKSWKPEHSRILIETPTSVEMVTGNGSAYDYHL